MTRSTSHSGNDFSPAVRARAVGSPVAAVTEPAQPVETLALRPDRRGGWTALVIGWGRARVTLPREAGGEDR